MAANAIVLSVLVHKEHVCSIIHIEPVNIHHWEVRFKALPERVPLDIMVMMGGLVQSVTDMVMPNPAEMRAKKV